MVADSVIDSAACAGSQAACSSCTTISCCGPALTGRRAASALAPFGSSTSAAPAREPGVSVGSAEARMSAT